MCTDVTPGKNHIGASSVSRFAYKSEIPVGRNPMQRIVSGVALAALCAVSFSASAISLWMGGDLLYGDPTIGDSNVFYTYAEAAAHARANNGDHSINCPGGQGEEPVSPISWVQTPGFFINAQPGTQQGNVAWSTWYNAQGQPYCDSGASKPVTELQLVCGGSYPYPYVQLYTGLQLGCHAEPPSCSAGQTYDQETGRCDAPLKNHGPPPCD